MSAVAIVAGGRDAQFAEQVRAGLQAAGREARLQSELPSDASTRVVLIWSSALEAGHAIDAQALVGLWSEERLVVADEEHRVGPAALQVSADLRVRLADGRVALLVVFEGLGLRFGRSAFP